MSHPIYVATQHTMYGGIISCANEATAKALLVVIEQTPEVLCLAKARPNKSGGLSSAIQMIGSSSPLGYLNGTDVLQTMEEFHKPTTTFTLTKVSREDMAEANKLALGNLLKLAKSLS